MTKRSCLWILFWAVAIWAFGLEGYIFAQEKVLRIYGPEGASAPMKECAEMFSTKYGIKAEVLAGPDATWIPRAKGDADVIYEGSEYMLTQFIASNS